jgi:glycosyltransferase involved in cell wall biosynthesis
VYGALASDAILRHASLLLFTAEGEREEMRPVGITRPSVVIPHGIDVSPAGGCPGRFRQQLLGGRSGPIVLYLGRLNEKKGLDIAIRAMNDVWAHSPTAILAIVGGAHPPSYEAIVRRWAAESSHRDAIVMTGVVSELQKADAYADADVFILPSEAENFGFAMFEAMAARVPVVVSDTLNYASHVREAGAGIVVERDPAAFGRAIIEVLSDADAARSMGANGPKLCAQFSWAACGLRFAEAIKAVVTGTPLPADLKPEYPV